MPEHGRRVLTLSPVYPVGDCSRFRIMDGQFVRISTEVDSWIYLEDLLTRPVVNAVICECGNPSEHITGWNSDTCCDCGKRIPNLKYEP